MTDKKNHEENEEVKVHDKRRFDSKGDVREGIEDIRTDNKEEDIHFGEPQGAPQDESGGEINFATFVFSLGSAALVELGAAPNPTTGKHQKNLSAAKQNINLLSLIQQKTKGNLSKDEEKLLDNFLYDLRMRYVDATKGDKQ